MALTPSRHNLLAPVAPGRGWVLANPLSGNADLLSEEEAAAWRRGDPVDRETLAQRGYLVEATEEQRRYREAYLRFTEEREAEEIQLLFAPTYACNFACSYCYQDEYPAPRGVVSAEVVRAFFDYVDQTFAGRRVYLTLFGGEPLLPTPGLRTSLELFVEMAARRALPLSVVTNGFYLTEALPLLQRACLREVQVTLDGPPGVHDRRRPLAGGGGTFERVAAGVDEALRSGVPINLRAVVDGDNLQHLPALARLAQQRGWTEHPLLKTQLGRNYELHHCQADRARLLSRLELYERFAALSAEHPELLRFHRPPLHGARRLASEGALPPPMFDACPGCTTEWAFDLEGRIYPCTATVGKPGEAVGRFHPIPSLDHEQVDEWEDRDVLSIPECAQCASQLLCGGGCGAVARSAHGRLHGPDCRPVPELLGLGLGLYLKETS